MPEILNNKNNLSVLQSMTALFDMHIHKYALKQIYIF